MLVGADRAEFHPQYLTHALMRVVTLGGGEHLGVGNSYCSPPNSFHWHLAKVYSISCSAMNEKPIYSYGEYYTQKGDRPLELVPKGMPRVVAILRVE